jgi:hypothetical protein
MVSAVLLATSRKAREMAHPPFILVQRSKVRAMTFHSGALNIGHPPEHIQLLLVFSAHSFLLPACAVETRNFSSQMREGRA